VKGEDSLLERVTAAEAERQPSQNSLLVYRRTWLIARAATEGLVLETFPAERVGGFHEEATRAPKGSRITSRSKLRSPSSNTSSVKARKWQATGGSGRTGMAHGAFSAPRSPGAEAIHFFGLFRCIRGSRLCIRRAVMHFTPSQKVVESKGETNHVGTLFL
jgi:hypothetical protein